MEIIIKPTGYYRKHLAKGKEEIKVNIDRATKIGCILSDLALINKDDQVSPVIIINGNPKDLRYIVQEGDKIILINMVSGG